MRMRGHLCCSKRADYELCQRHRVHLRAPTLLIRNSEERQGIIPCTRMYIKRKINMLFCRNVFISHSSENKEIAEQLSAYIERLGVRAENIFCSSIISQGVNNGEKLGTAISDAINKSKVLIFLLSNDFIHSTYCMQELGVGWHLSERGKAKCFCLVLPDITLAEVKGFINSKIFKFTFIDGTHKSELSLFADNICVELHLKQQKHSVQNNYENIFYSAIDSMLIALTEKKAKKENEEKARNSLVSSMEGKLSIKDDTISKLKREIENTKKGQEEELLLCELRVIENRFMYLGFGHGISREQYHSFSKQFWFNMVNRYEDLMDELHLQARNDSMELLLACIYSAENMEEKAYLHLKNYVSLERSQIYYRDLSNFFEGYKRSMKEVIDILENKIKKEKEGIVKDSYIELKDNLEKREEMITQASSLGEEIHKQNIVDA